jgi:hypothetical protein
MICKCAAYTRLVTVIQLCGDIVCVVRVQHVGDVLRSPQDPIARTVRRDELTALYEGFYLSRIKSNQAKTGKKPFPRITDQGFVTAVTRTPRPHLLRRNKRAHSQLLGRQTESPPRLDLFGYFARKCR